MTFSSFLTTFAICGYYSLSFFSLRGATSFFSATLTGATLMGSGSFLGLLSTFLSTEGCGDGYGYELRLLSILILNASESFFWIGISFLTSISFLTNGYVSSFLTGMSLLTGLAANIFFMTSCCNLSAILSWAADACFALSSSSCRFFSSSF